MKMRLSIVPPGLAVCGALFALLLAGSALEGLAQQTASNSAGQPLNSGSNTLSQAQIDNIISRFTAKETEFRRALNEYAFKRDALVQVIGMGGQVTGEYHRVSDFTFDNQGNRYEKINFFPMSSIGEIITAEDLEDLGGVNPFALEADKISQYNFKYVGKERIDELDLYVFDVAPKVIPDPKKKIRMFVGRIWVDDHDLQIVKSKGKGVPETKTNKFPVVETYREQIDGKYWFPTYSYADDDLIFDNGTDMRIRMRVKYTDFVVGRGKVTITEIGETLPDSAKPQNRPSPSSTSPTQPGTETPTRAPSRIEAGQTIEGGIINSKALELPQPKYPATATRARASGQVQVRVLVDETGKVISAEALFGPPSLRAAAVEAAKQAKFAPAKIDGVPVKVSGILTYDFTAP
jgi:TonB family protein